MKKNRFVLSALLALLILVAPAFAFDWPPENYDMPRTVLTTDTIKDSLTGLVNSIRSIADTGLLILAVLLPLFLILPLFEKLVFGNLKGKNLLGKNGLSGITEMERKDLLRKDFQSVQAGPDLNERLFLNESDYSSQGHQLESPSDPGGRKRRRRR